MNNQINQVTSVYSIADAVVIQKQEPQYRFLLSASKLDNLDPMEWLIDGILAMPSVTVMVAQPGVGKTLLALDIASCIATGKDWHGFKTTQKKVVFIEAEGQRKLADRRDAWLNINKQPKHLFDENIWFVFESCQFSKEDDVKKLIQDLENMPDKPGLLVIDTLARCNAGSEENSTKEMSVFMDDCGRIAQTLNLAVLILHHPQKNGTAGMASLRGSSTIAGAADTIIGLVERKDGFQMTCYKQKDELPFKDMHFLRQSEPLSKSVCVVSTNTLGAINKSKQPEEDEHLQKIKDTLKKHGKLKPSKLQEFSGVPSTTFYTKIKLLVRSNVVAQDDEKFYYLIDENVT